MKCEKCKKPLDIKVDYYESIIYFLSKKTINKESYRSSPICLNCFNEIDIYTLAELGLKNLGERNKPVSAGTDFYRIYNNEARVYDAFSKAEDKEDKILKFILKYLNKDSIVLDLGAGTGKYANKISNHAKKVYALDISSNLLNHARKNNNKKNIEFILSSAEKIPLLENSVDLIYSTWASFPIFETFKEMKRVLKNNGKIIRVATVDYDDLTSLYSSFDKELIIKQNRFFQNNGFKNSHKEISIEFDSINQANKILKLITKAKPKIKKRKLNHKVIIQVYKNDKLQDKI